MHRAALDHLLHAAHTAIGICMLRAAQQDGVHPGFHLHFEHPFFMYFLDFIATIIASSGAPGNEITPRSAPAGTTIPPGHRCEIPSRFSEGQELTL